MGVLSGVGDLPVGSLRTIPDSGEVREVDSREVHETLPEAQNRPGDEEAEEDFRKADAGAIGFYDEAGNELTAEEFERLFSSSSDRDE